MNKTLMLSLLTLIAGTSQVMAFQWAQPEGQDKVKRIPQQQGKWVQIDTDSSAATDSPNAFIFDAKDEKNNNTNRFTFNSKASARVYNDTDRLTISDIYGHYQFTCSGIPSGVGYGIAMRRKSATEIDYACRVIPMCNDRKMYDADVKFTGYEKGIPYYYCQE